MFWKNKMKFENQVRTLSTSKQTNASRRAINLMPLPVSSDDHEIVQTQSIRFHHLLVNIEGNERSCCLRIISPKKKSRSAFLIYKGRVVGCLYGQKDLDFQIMQADAWMHALKELAMPGNILDAYQLPENLVLAAASLFHGQALSLNETGSPTEMMNSTFEQITNYALPACIIFNTNANAMICQVYMDQGKIIGIYSSKDGWIELTKQAIMSYLKDHNNYKVMASILPLHITESIAAFGFSLTGLGDLDLSLKRIDQFKQKSYLHQNALTHETFNNSDAISQARFSFGRQSQKKKSLDKDHKQSTYVPADVHQHYPNIRRLYRKTAIRHFHVISP